MEQHYRKIVQDTDNRAAYSLRSQELRTVSPHYGGFYDKDGLVQAKYSIYRTASMAAAYCCEDSKYYHNPKIEESLFLGLSYIRHVQHENGLFDYITCNFFSAPDTAFCIKKMIPVYEYLDRLAQKTQVEKQLWEEFGDIIRKGAFGLLLGGFHTPNHRWAIASILAKCGILFHEQELTEAAEAYLLEGIDCNEDGEFSEKSAGNYNRINNDAMITLAEALKEDSYEQYAIRNLKMMLTYLEPDGSIFTANSTRFDKDRHIFPKDYYIEYLRMGMKYHIPEFLDMCNTIFDIVKEKQITSPDFLIWFMLSPEYRELEWKGHYQQNDFFRHYKKSGIIRARCQGITYTALEKKSDFLYINTGTIQLMVKVAGSFCEHRAFRAETMEISELPNTAGSLQERTLKKIRLHQVMRGWYYLPFPEKPDTSDWWQMNHAARPKKNGPDMDIEIEISELAPEMQGGKGAGGLKLQVKTCGVCGAPWRIEIALAGIEALSSPWMHLPVHGDEVLVIRDGMLTAYNQKDALCIGPGFGTHHFTEGKEDSEAKTPGCATIYFTDYTEFDHTIFIYRTEGSYV